MTDLVFRDLQFDRGAASGDVVPATISTDVAVDRGDFREVLLHEPAAVDLSRFPISVIESHDTSTLPVAIAENPRIERGRLRVDIRFGASARAKELLQDVRSGVTRYLSIGYRIVRHQWDAARETLTATFWCPHECSIVAVPADPGAQFFRGHVTMTPETVSGERDRAREILALARLHGQAELGERAVAEGQPLEAFRTVLLEKLQAGQRPAAPSIDWSRGERERYSVLRAIRAMVDPRLAKEAAFEREVSDHLAQRSGRTPTGFLVPHDVFRRTLTTGTASGSAKSGFLVGTDHLGDQFIDVLRNASVVIQAGARTLMDLRGNVAIPKLVSGTAVEWVAEGNAPTAGAPVFGQVTLTPKTVIGYVDITRRLMLQSVPDADAVVMADLAAGIGTAIDAAAIGFGATNAPTGVLGTSGIGSYTTATSGSAPSRAMFTALVQELAVDNSLRGSVAWITNSKVMTKSMNTLLDSGSGRYLVEAYGEPLLGFPVYVSGNVPSNRSKGSSGATLSCAIVGAWQDLLIGFWSGVDVYVDRSSLSTSGGVRIVAAQDADVNVRYAESFAACTSIITV